jgi:putative addiction module component (TIGR02574 family)
VPTARPGKANRRARGCHFAGWRTEKAEATLKLRSGCFKITETTRTFLIRGFYWTFQAMDIATALAEIKQLSVNERLAIVGAIWDSIDGQTPLELSAADRAELDRRLEQIDRNPDSGIAWDDLKRQLQSGR